MGIAVLALRLGTEQSGKCRAVSLGCSWRGQGISRGFRESSSWDSAYCLQGTMLETALLVQVLQCF